MLLVLPMPRALPPARGAVGPSLHTPPSQGARSASGAKVSRSRACGLHPSTCTGHREPVEALFKEERARRFSPRINQGSALDTSVKPTNSNQRPQSTASRRRREDDMREERALLRRHQWSSSREGFAPAPQTSGNGVTHEEVLAPRSTGLWLRNLKYSNCEARLSGSQGQCEGKGGGQTREPGKPARSESRERRSCGHSGQESRTQALQPRGTWL